MSRKTSAYGIPRWVQWLLVLACFGFLGKTLAANPAQTWAGLRQLRPAPVVIGLACVWGGHYLTHAVLWFLITRRAGMRLTWPAAVRMWSDSLLGRYLPGRVWGLAVRVEGCRRAGESIGRASRALLMEAVITVASAGGISLLVLLRFDPGPGTVAALCGVLVLVALALSRPGVISWALRSLAKWKGTPATSVEDPAPAHLWDLWLLSMAGYGLSGIGFFLFLRGVTPLALTSLPYAAGALFFAGLAGMLAIFVPSGLGVREGILTVLLLPLLPSPLAALAALLSRPWMIVAEVLWYACARLLWREIPPPRPVSAPAADDDPAGGQTESARASQTQDTCSRVIDG